MKPITKINRFAWSAGLAAGCGLFAAMGGVATAQSTPPTCASLVDGTTKKLFYMSGSSAFEPTLARLALKLADRYVIVFQTSGSGAGAKDIFNDLNLSYVSGKTHYYAPDATKGWVAADCTPDTATPPKSQIGVSDVHPTNFGVEATAIGTVGQVATGPVQAMLFVGPTADGAPTAITADQARALFTGCTTATLPWTETFDRGSGSGTQVMISKYIGSGPEFSGAPADGNQSSTPKSLHHGLGGGSTGMYDLIPRLAAATDKAKALGILSADTYDAGTNRQTFHALAFQGLGQKKAYFADSSATSFDRRNVRDGHYLIEGPVHFSLRTTPSADAMAVLGFLTGSTALVSGETDNKSYVQAISNAGMIPLCAMKVQRASEGGFLSPYTLAKACGCFFEANVPGATGAPASCAVCNDTTPCTGGKSCNYGFCE